MAAETNPVSFVSFMGISFHDLLLELLNATACRFGLFTGSILIVMPETRFLITDQRNIAYNQA